jgi:hypothetical protein
MRQNMDLHLPPVAAFLSGKFPRNRKYNCDKEFLHSFPLLYSLVLQIIEKMARSRQVTLIHSDVFV